MIGRSLLAAALAASLSGAGCGIAAADPAAPAPDPALVAAAPEAAVPVAAPAGGLAGAVEQVTVNPMSALAQLLTGAGGPAGAVSQGVGLNTPPPVDPLAAVGSLMAQNFRMPAGDENSPYVLQTDVAPSPFARVDAFRGAHAMIHGALGRMPGDQLGQPLPGTAPPPGTNIPAGIEQFMAPPADPAQPVESAPPLITPVS